MGWYIVAGAFVLVFAAGIIVGRVWQWWSELRGGL